MGGAVSDRGRRLSENRRLFLRNRARIEASPDSENFHTVVGMNRHRFVFYFLSVTLLCLSGRGEEGVKIRGKIVDSDSPGDAVHARLYIESEEAKNFVAISEGGIAIPYEITRGGSVEVHTSLSAHPFSVVLPPGKYTFTAEKGKEFIPVQREVTVSAGAPEVVLSLQRWIDMSEGGWFSGETHVHRTIDDLKTLMLCEDLNVALPLTAWVSKLEDTPFLNNRNTDPVPPGQLIKIDDTHVIWPRNTEYEITSVNGQRHVLGALFVLNHQKKLRLPAMPVRAVAEEARRQGAILDLDKQNWPWSMMLIPQTKVNLFELTNNHIWRTEFMFKSWFPEYVADYMNIEKDETGLTENGWIDFGFQNYYALLNCGFNIKPSGGTASGVHPVPLGYGRVYVQLEGEFNYDAWMEGLEKGRSFVTTGPMLEVTVGGKGPGERISLVESGTGVVKVRGKVSSPVSQALTKIEIVVNGKVVESIPVASKETRPGGLISREEITTEVSVKESSWIVVRAFADRGNGRRSFAHSSPVYVDVPGKPLRPRKEEVEFLLKRVRDEITRHEGVLSEEEVKEFREAAEFYEGLLTLPTSRR